MSGVRAPSSRASSDDSELYEMVQKLEFHGAVESVDFAKVGGVVDA